jgi:hypothetical protein
VRAVLTLSCLKRSGDLLATVSVVLDRGRKELSSNHSEPVLGRLRRSGCDVEVDSYKKKKQEW